MLNQDTDRTQAVRLNHLSPSWVMQLDEEVGNRGMHCELNVFFRGLARPITYIKEEMREMKRKARAKNTPG